MLCTFVFQICVCCFAVHWGSFIVVSTLLAFKLKVFGLSFQNVKRATFEKVSKERSYELSTQFANSDWMAMSKGCYWTRTKLLGTYTCLFDSLFVLRFKLFLEKNVFCFCCCFVVWLDGGARREGLRQFEFFLLLTESMRVRARKTPTLLLYVLFLVDNHKNTTPCLYMGYTMRTRLAGLNWPVNKNGDIFSTADQINKESAIYVHMVIFLLFRLSTDWQIK